MVMVLEANVADTPAGKPLAPDMPVFEIPVAPEVVWVILVRAVLIHKVGVEVGDPAVLAGLVVKVDVLETKGEEHVNEEV